MARHAIATTHILLVYTLLACGGDGGSGDGPTTPPGPTAPTASAIAAVSGSGQTGKAEAALASPLIVKVTSSSGAAISGITVTFATNAGSVNPSSASTDANGNAQATWTLGSTIGVQSATATAAGLSGSPVSFSATAQSAWTLDATVLTNTDAGFGGATGGLANVTVFKLKDDRYRMIIGASPGTANFRSAISSDGVVFTLESGFRFECPQTCPGYGQPFAIHMDDGRVKMFVRDAQITGSGRPVIERGVYSFTSTDEGLTFTPDDGVRITAAAAGTNGVSGPVIVRMTTGGWRMYFSDATKPGDVSPKKIVSARSNDLMTWTMDAGVRIGAGSPAVTGGGEHPGAIANADGSITLVYLRVLPPGPHFMFYSTSSDGVSFPREARIGLPLQATLTPIEGNDPELLHLGNGDVRMWYGFGDNDRGTILTAHRAPFKVNTP